jgi:hypothetical protein
MVEEAGQWLSGGVAPAATITSPSLVRHSVSLSEDKMSESRSVWKMESRDLTSLSLPE